MAYTFKHGDRPLDGLTIQRAVGRGGFGEVYYARTDSGKEVALKYLRDNPEIELRGVAQVMNLKSPHLITIYDVRSNAESEPFVIMEYISGPSLHELMNAEPRGVGVQKAAFFLSGIAKGLSYLHDRGIVHRDLKPGNIFYDEGYVKIGDYGLSKHMSVSRHSGQTVSVGTVHYMAPEIGSGSYSKAIDIYALGVILYEMLTGKLPFTGSSMAEVLMRHLQDRPDMAGIPEPFAAVIAKALQKNPTDRYQDVNEMVDAVMASQEINASFSTFDPRSLSQAPRRDPADDLDRTMTTPPRVPPLPSLDVRGAAPAPQPQQVLLSDLPAIPPIPPLPGERQRHGERVADWRQGGRVAGVRMRIFGGVAQPAMAQAPQQLVQSEMRKSWPTMITLLVVMGASAGLLTTIVDQNGEGAAAFGLCLLGGTAGILLSHLKLLANMQPRSAVVDHIVVAATATVFMIPGIAIAAEEARGVFRLVLPLIGSLLILNWGKLIEQGRSGIINGWSSLGPAILGLVLAKILGGRLSSDFGWAAAGFMAALALLVQIGASMYPRRAAATFAPTPAPQPPPQAEAAAAADRKWLASMAENTHRAADWAYNKAVGAVEQTVSKIEEWDERAADKVEEKWHAIRERTADRGGQPTRPIGPVATMGWRIALVLCIAGSVGFFVALGNLSPYSNDRAPALFGGLAGIAMLPFLLTKVFQKTAQPLWNGTIRWLLVSLSLLLSAGMIAALAFEAHASDEKAGAVFGLLVGLMMAFVFLTVGGNKPAAAPASTAQSVPSEDSAPAIPPGYRAVQPSFVGRTANAGLGFVGKSLLVGGLALAMLSTARGIHISGPSGEFVSVDSRSLVVNSVRGGTVAVNIPPAAYLLPLLLGGVVLAVARRNDGGMHVVRGLAGAACGIVAAWMALGPAAPAIVHLAHGGEFESGQQIKPLLPVFMMVLCSMALLFWPRRPAAETIVI